MLCIGDIYRYVVGLVFDEFAGFFFGAAAFVQAVNARHIIDGIYLPADYRFPF